MKAKNKFVIWSIEIKKEAKNVVLIFKKDIWKKKKALIQWILQNILENQAFQGAAMFNENGKYCYISKSRRDTQYLDKSASHWLLVEIWRWNWVIKVFAGAFPSMSIRLLRSCFVKGAGFISLSRFLINFFS